MDYEHILQFFIIPFVMSLITQLLSRIENFSLTTLIESLQEIDYNNVFNKRYTICLKGERIRSVCQYSGEANIVESFTNTFSALWEYIINSHEYTDILEITELNNKSSSRIDKEQKTFYYVSQNKKFLIDKSLKLYGKTNLKIDTQEKKGGGTIDSNMITIELFSYTTPIEKIKVFLNDITHKYVEKIKTEREKKQFIYSIKHIDNEDYYDSWYESEFSTTRTFDNLFFNEKECLLKKINFFLNNKEWYHEKGIPYTLGIGLSGEPGTGKTSIIKAIAQYTNRHIINLSMKLFKSRKQLYQFFYETTYNRKNVSESITYDKKIIVIEDIDCLGDIVLKREKQIAKEAKEDDTKKMLQTILENSEKGEDGEKTSVKISSSPSDPITLDDVLNIWDGIQEHYGRIMIITSNHYDKLDPALTRPGRIDIKLEMSYLSKQSIQQIYKHLYEKNIPKTMIKKLPDYKYTPAKIMNIYLNNQQDDKSFLKEICKKM
tara:strand:- start:34237 stop:35706 length:1470 start_codon:yes stop_codon:yes gene_type:complete